MKDYEWRVHVRGCDNDLGVDQLLVEGGALALLVRCSDQSVAGILEPLANAELVLSCAEKLRNLMRKLDGYH